MQPVKKEDLMKFRFLSELSLSPDRTKLAMVESYCDEKKNAILSDIDLLDIATGQIRKMTSRGDGKGILWLDGNSLLFTASRDSEDAERRAEGERFTDFYLLYADGGEAEKFLEVPVAGARLFVIGPDDYMVLGRMDLRKTEVNGLSGKEREEAVKQYKEDCGYEIYDELPFRINGAGTVNKIRNTLFRYRKDAGGAFTLTQVTDKYADAASVKVRNGKVYYTTETYTDIHHDKRAVWVYDPLTEESECLLPEGDYSVSGLDVFGNDLLLAACDQKLFGSTESDDFFLLSPDGSVKKWVTLGDGVGSAIGTDCHYGMSDCICVCEDAVTALLTEHTGTSLVRFERDGSRTTLYDGPLTIDGFAGADDTFYVTAMGPDSLQELYLLKDGVMTKLTHLHDDYLAQTEISVPKRCDAVTSSGTVEGFVIRPFGYEPGKKYPAILDIHGGPRAAYGDVFFHEMQLWAGMGYFVFFCNPRGSAGRGDAFADIRGDYGGKDYEDIMAFTDHVLKSYPDIDEKKVGVTGGSYGGYMTNWIVGQTDRFAAAAAQRSISNWVTKILSTDIGYLYNMDQQQATPWDHPEKLWDRSPLKYADRVKTPLLLFQSDEDYRCWQAEAIQFFTALKLNGAEVKMCLVHGENHNLSRSGRPVQRLRRLTALTDWMEEHLKEDSKEG